jgi:hypothetical protein
LRLCDRDHHTLHSGNTLHVDLSKGILLGVKQECDPDNYDPAYLASLRHKKHLGYDPEPLPDYYAKERERNTGSWTSRNP